MQENELPTLSKKLPWSVQLVALTAVLVFCVAVIAVYSYVRVLVRDWGEISQVPNVLWLFVAPGRSAVLALASAATFVFFLVRPVTQVKRAATAYVVVLLLWICWEPAYWIAHGYEASTIFSFRRPAMAFRYIYFAWVCVLLYLLNPSFIANLRRK